jgi:hypothetical protein
MAHKQEMLQQKADNDKIIKKLYYEAKQQLDSLNMEKQELEKKINDQNEKNKILSKSYSSQQDLA